jgi:Ca2+-binding RTX toxin-like protein
VEVLVDYFGTESNDTVTGDNADNGLYGLGGDDLLQGLDGDDLLDGGTGADAMEGGAGDDIYIVDDSGDLVTEDEDSGTDEVRTSLAFYVLPDHVENVTALSAAGQVLDGNGLDNVMTGGDGDDSLWGAAGDDIFHASGGADRIDGGLGDDMLVLPGALSDYAFVRDETGLHIHDLTNGLGDISGGGIEAFHFEGEDATYSEADIFDRHGTAGDDTLSGDDSWNLIYGYDGDDVLVGGGGDDMLDGGAGADTMTGGAGGDTYYVDDAGDVVVEAANGGFDRVITTHTSHTLAANVEWLFSATDLNSTLIGNACDNMIVAGAGDDWLEGGGGHDQLDGREGADTMIGGAGNDGYFVDNAGDVVTEGAGAGIDWVATSLASYTLPANVENLYALSSGQTLTGNALNNFIQVGSGANVASGGAGTDTLSYGNEVNPVTVDLQTGEKDGEAADDTLSGFENLTGGWADDVLRGTSAANVLDGGSGADTLVGRGGNDIYYVDDEGDDVVESAGQGNDEVRTWLDTYSLADEVERLKYIGEDAFTGIGNALNNIITGGAGDDELSGGDGHDSLYGGLGDDSLYGEDGHDLLDGGGGADSMDGGAGNDGFLVDNSGDIVSEAADEGIDQVYSTIADYTLPDNVENLSFSLGAAVHGVGNALGNIIYGGSGADLLEGAGGDDELRGGMGGDTLEGGDGDDLLVGGSGVDILNGGAGADTFRFASYESGTGAAADLIEDFASGEDVIDLAQIDANFLAAGDQAFTFIGAAAFSSTAGELRYRTDGTDTWLEGDTDGDGLANFEIVLAGAPLPVAGDFVL